jgi:glycosyltransferase involved in cell wall biosynthesis
MNNLSVIIPIYNEENGIGRTIENVNTQLLQLFDKSKYEIICVNDYSIDGTKEVLTKYQDQIVIITHKKNRGYGASLKTGISAAKNDWILIIDADGTYDPSYIPSLIQSISDEETMVVGNRIGEGIKASYPHMFARWILRKIAYLLSGQMVPDLNSGLRIFNKKIYYKYKHLLPNKFSFTTTITMCYLYNGLDLKFIPINYKKRIGKSNIKPISDFFGFTVLIIRLAVYFEPLAFFLPLFYFCGLLGIVKGGIDFINLGQIGALSIILIFLSINFFSLGLISDLIIKRSER